MLGLSIYSLKSKWDNLWKIFNAVLGTFYVLKLIDVAIIIILVLLLSLIWIVPFKFLTR